MIRYIESAGPGGSRNIGDLAIECEKVGGDALPVPGSVSAGSTLFVKNACGPSRAARLAVENLHQTDNISIRNVTEDAAALDALKSVGGQNQAPCLVVDGQPVFESVEIVGSLVHRVAPLP